MVLFKFQLKTGSHANYQKVYKLVRLKVNVTLLQSDFFFINEVTYGKLKTPLKVNGNLKVI